MSTNGYRDYKRTQTPRPYSEEDAQTVDQAKRIHKETTASAERALKTAQRTRELGQNTLEELQRQGDKLETIDQDLHAIDDDVKESKGLLSYMQRCCLCFLFSCCCDCDPSVEKDKTRKRRVSARNQDRKEFKNMIAESRTGTNGLPDDVKNPVAEDETRSSLFKSKSDISKAKQDQRDRNSAYDIGKGLEEGDRKEILKETEQQEKALDAIDVALDDMKRMGQTMREELKYQEDVLQRVDNHTDMTHAGLKDVQTSAEKTLGSKGTKKVNRRYMPTHTDMARQYMKSNF